MDRVKKRKKVVSGGRPPRGARRKHPGCYPTEIKLKAVKLYLEEGYPADMIAGELGITSGSVKRWVKIYQDKGDKGLEPPYRLKGRQQVSPAVKSSAVALKRDHPEYGSRRISHILKRIFLMQASPETVRRTLHQENLIDKPKKKPVRSVKQPRFFERAHPNQLWQSDIFTFRLGGRAAYLIGYMDDYSRYITGIGLYRSQTAEHVLEVYRRGIAEYGVPKEMLTDNGRQYINWRGTTRFEKELGKDRVKHIKSRPHHPMTLGKLERFWKTIYVEFLSRVQFDSFEEAGERLSLWIKYYNHRRPHQGIGGLCPADRFYEIQTALRGVMERGISENVLETALRGKPRQPFYMVGRMGDQSVVIHAEEGKVKMTVDGSDTCREMMYPLKETGHDKQIREEAASDVYVRGEMPGRIVGMVADATAEGDLPGTGNQLGHAESLAAPGHGRDDGSPGTAPSVPGGEGTQPGTPPGDIAGQDGAKPQQGNQAGPEVTGYQGGEAAGTGKPIGGWPHGIGRIGPETGSDHHQGAERSTDGDRGGPSAGDIPQGVLQMGTAGIAGPDQSRGRPAGGPAIETGGSREGGFGEKPVGGGTSTPSGRATGRDPGLFHLRFGESGNGPVMGDIPGKKRGQKKGRDPDGALKNG